MIIKYIEEYLILVAFLQVISIESKAVDNVFKGIASDVYKHGTLY